MLIKYISPLSDLESEVEPFFSNEYMLAFFKKFCNAIQSRMWRLRKARNARYEAEDFLKVFFYSELTGRSIRSASERLNKYYIAKRRGKRKTYADGREKRAVPHQTDVNRFLRKIKIKTARNLLKECLHDQLKEAIKLDLVSKKVDVLIDFTEHAYYGKRDDKMIKGTNRQKGTKKMRHYLGFSILSRGNQIFIGLEQVPKGQSKIPIILETLDSLLELGLEFKHVLMDREFYRTELLDEIKGMKGNVLIPAKSYKKVRTIITEYLEGNGKRIRKYVFSTAHGAKFQFFQNVYLILNAKKGHSLLEVKRGVQNGKISLTDGSKLIYAIMTTEKPKGVSSSWASRISRKYKERWHIETGFSDLNRIAPRWKSRHDNVRYLDLLMRMLLYNSWKINRAYIKKLQNKGKTSSIWTLQDNQDALVERFLEA